MPASSTETSRVSGGGLPESKDRISTGAFGVVDITAHRERRDIFWIARTPTNPVNGREPQMREHKYLSFRCSSKSDLSTSKIRFVTVYFVTRGSTIPHYPDFRPSKDAWSTPLLYGDLFDSMQYRAESETQIRDRHQVL
jgi:hypothetical protein